MVLTVSREGAINLFRGSQGCLRPWTDHINGPYELVSDKIVYISILISWPTLGIGQYINIDILTHPRYRRPDIAMAVLRYALAKRAVAVWSIIYRAFQELLGTFGSIFREFWELYRAIWGHIAYRRLGHISYCIACATIL